LPAVASSHAPSGFPYLLLDRVEEMDAGVHAVATKLVSANEPYFLGHFPGVPLVPGVLLCEALAQLGAALLGDAEGLALAAVERARFRRPVIPGDALRLEVTTRAAGRLRGRVTAGESLVAEVDFALAPPAGPRVHPTAVVAAGAHLDAGVRVGPYAVVGPHVRVGAGTWIGSHAVLDGRTTLGSRNRVFPFASVGAPPQDLKYRGEPSTLTIGDGNTFREYVSVNPGTEGGGMETVVGNGGLFMVSSHVAHDCRLGDSVILANGVALGGHVVMEDYAIVGGLAGVHQFARVGTSALCAAGAMVSQDVPPYCTVAGDRARLFGLNLVGLKRRGFSDDTILALKRAYRLLFLGGGGRDEALARVRAEVPDVPEVARLCDFVAGSERGVCR
jgi:UDP-N-acetylglucosamine acyltransferase